MSSSPSEKPSPPVRKIPGSHGLPLVGPIWDRFEYSWFQGPDKFFTTRIEKYKSTVFRTNVPPTFPFYIGVNPNVIAVLDCKSFSHLFDMDLVEKKNVLIGDYMPSVNFTGGERVCAYLDTSEPNHTKIKSFSLDILKRSSTIWVPTLVTKLDTMWDTIESTLSKSGSANYKVPLSQTMFSFLTRCIIGADTASSPEIDESGYSMVGKWVYLQIHPVLSLGLFQPFEEIFLHSFPYPFAIVSGHYKKLIEFIEKEGKEVIERGQTEFKLSHHETIHNLLFILGFNAFAGFLKFLPSLMKALTSDNTGLQKRLRNEVRETSGLTLSFELVRGMELVQSFVYETLRLNPPVPMQYGRARKDFLLSSHDSVFEIKKGELLCGYQTLVMRDPNVFDDPETFNPDRFTKEKGRELLSHLYWSNGPQTESPSVSNKQCAAKDHVTLTACLFVTHLFRRYDSITCNSSGLITAVEKAE